MSSSRLRVATMILSFPFAIGVAGCSSDPATSLTAASCSEANFVTDIPGALAYPCEVAP